MARRLAAILSADIVGYSTLMAEDEETTLADLKEHRATVFDPTIAQHGGRIVKIMGDGVLVEFGSVLDAVASAVAIQTALAKESAGKFKLRIGINLCDVLVEGDDIYGDGVNIAARLESIAEPGGICISGKVFEEVKGKIDIATEDLGDVPLKNIGTPVRCYHVQVGASRSAPAHPTSDHRPAIAVLCFDNMSGDPAEDYFCAGITEHIITDLARFRDLSVISRNSSFAYRGMAVSVPQISREIGAHYILAGSVQRYGARVRVTAQLLEGETGRQLWADRYDRHVEDIFAVQDELTETIVSTVATAYGGRLQKAWQNRRKRVAEPSFAAFDSFLCGIHSFDSFTQEGLAQARMHFEEAIRIQPAYAKALAKLSWAYMIEISHGWRASDEESWQTALSFAEASVAADDDEAWGHWALAGYRLFRGQHALALVECERALALNPNDADILTDYAYCLSNAGRAHEAVEQALRAIHLNPHHPDWYACQLGGIFFDCERYADAITTLEGIPRFEGRTKMIYLAASYAALDRIEEARSVVERIRQSEPSATVESCTTAEATPYKQPADLDRLRRCLAKAGLQPMSGGRGVP